MAHANAPNAQQLQALADDCWDAVRKLLRDTVPTLLGETLTPQRRREMEQHADEFRQAVRACAAPVRLNRDSWKAFSIVLIGRVTKLVLDLLESFVSWDELRPAIIDLVSGLRISDLAARAGIPNTQALFRDRLGSCHAQAKTLREKSSKAIDRAREVQKQMKRVEDATQQAKLRKEFKSLKENARNLRSEAEDAIALGKEGTPSAPACRDSGSHTSEKLEKVAKSTKRVSPVAKGVGEAAQAAVAGAVVGLGMAAATEFVDGVLSGEASVKKRAKRVGKTTLVSGAKAGASHLAAKGVGALVKEGSQLGRLTAAGSKGLTNAGYIAQSTLVASAGVAAIEAGTAIYKNLTSDDPSARDAAADVLDVSATAAATWGASALGTAAAVAVLSPAAPAAVAFLVTSASASAVGYVGSWLGGKLTGLVTNKIRRTPK